MGPSLISAAIIESGDKSKKWVSEAWKRLGDWGDIALEAKGSMISTDNIRCT